MTEGIYQNNYELYRVIRSKDKYFATWSSESYRTVSEDLGEVIYEKYLVKCKVFQRDNFKCQNSKCTTPNSPLTYHHIKWKKNNGMDKVKNGVTLCKSCHMGFHKGRKEIKYFYARNVPAHIRGHTFKLNIKEKLDWKQVRFQMSELRKQLKHEHGIIITSLQWQILMKFLITPYYEWDDE